MKVRPSDVIHRALEVPGRPPAHDEGACFEARPAIPIPKRFGGISPARKHAVQMAVAESIRQMGAKLCSELPPNVQECIETAIENYRGMGYSETDLEGLRYALAEQLCTMCAK